MDSARWKQIEYLFDEAGRLSPEARDAFLERECGDDHELLAEVRALLEADTAGHSLLDGVAIDAIDLAAEFSLQGRTIGPWRIVERIATGGMGAVYLAERADGQFEQRVAFKVIKLGMDTEEILRRFHSERQILARLAHPNIARLLDGGVTDEGVPYFTMEYVEGTPIDAYCDQRRLTVDQRLELFETVCEAVQYAQRNLVVHRDLKPGNILVSDEGTVKLLDFGIAKLVGEDDNENTRTGIRVMTPGYAAPEQVRGEPVTTATDVYALGVILYELLAGQRPYRVELDTPQELERAILETDPERPSTAFARTAARQDASGSTTTITAGTISESRCTEPAQLRRKLRGDLDNVCLMALRKEPERRYHSAEQLLLEIRRYREGRPVVARKDTTAYRVRKFVQRNVVAVVAAAAIVTIVAVLIGFYTSRLAHERDRARLEARKAEQVSAFLTSIFDVSDPNESRGEKVTARELLDRGAQRLHTELADQPEVRGLMLQVIGKVYISLGLYPSAEELLKESLSIRRRYPGEDDRDLIESLGNLGNALIQAGRYDQADTILREASQRAVESLRPGDITTLEMVSSRAILTNERGHYAEAESLFRQIIDLTATSKEERARERRAITLNDLALVLHEQGRYAEARPVFERALAEQPGIFGDVHPEVATTLYNYGTLLRDMGEDTEAEKVARRGLAMDRQVYGDDHPDVAYSMVSLATTLQKKGDYEGARELLEEAHALRLRALGEEHPSVAFGAGRLSNLYIELGQIALAESLATFSLNIHRRVQGEDHMSVAAQLDALGRIAQLRGDFSKAEQLHSQSLDIKLRTNGPDMPSVPLTTMLLGDAIAGQGRYEESERIHRGALSEVRRIRGERHSRVTYHLHALARVLCKTGELDEAERLCRESVDILESQFGSNDVRTAAGYQALAEVLVEKGDGDALRLFDLALNVRRMRLPANSLQIGASYVGLGRALCAQGRSREGLQAFNEGVRILLTSLPEGHPRVVAARAAFAGCGSSNGVDGL